jgi:hypothetical protein
VVRKELNTFNLKETIQSNKLNLTHNFERLDLRSKDQESNGLKSSKLDDNVDYDDRSSTDLWLHDVMLDPEGCTAL